MNAARGPIFWHQGMFLQPQHFQLAERGVHSLLTPYHTLLTPHFWGVSRAEVRIVSKGLCSIELTGGAFLFPDGTYIELPGNAIVQSRLLPQEEVWTCAPFTVYLGLRKWQEEAENATCLQQDDSPGMCNTRYLVASDPVSCPDLHAGGPTAEVRRLDHVLKLFWESELDLLGDYLLLPLTRLETRGDGLHICPDFIPPCLTIAAVPLLADLVRGIRDLVAARARRLESTKKQRGVTDADFGSKDLVYLFALRTVNRYLAQLDHLIQARAIHPWQLYGVLAQLVAELSCLSGSVTSLETSVPDDPGILAGYNHLDLGGCFAQAHDAILKLLDQLCAGPEYAVSLSFDGNYYWADLTPAHFQGRNRFYLAITTEADPASVLESLASVAKLAARERLPLLMAQALPGVPLEHQPNPPQELPRRASSLYFAIDSRSDHWEQVRKWNNVALFWDQAPDDLKAELMIVTRG
ncbi:type VI secretion system baseplate subunit TssK [Geomonas subterranea]|uniref:Type VI secretion system baseplate subunit TssK n=1 Tax=Geomonas subterranea TaxID=2847989 RepID=A0ABX8LTM7_9BACT|nr:type VI secretion system baseplate subunit TssK [Geomonas subterranea]QXE92850.1 type VI secretion system baseplate subunit TssK [Geomonas subterranea]QXM09045.1 type VI secretion system baseplate subunit TssK [Geomonas subterranea]